jgi:hypothetical protein
MTMTAGAQTPRQAVKPDIEVRCGHCGAYLQPRFRTDREQRVTFSAPCAVCEARNELTMGPEG